MMKNDTKTLPLLRIPLLGIPSSLIALVAGMLVSLLLGVNALQAASTNQTPTNQESSQSNELEWKGLVEAVPASGLAGTWTIGGLDFVADANTQLDETNGLLTSRACAEVSYAESAGQKLALSIESEADPTCAPEANDDDAEDDGEEGDDEEGDDEEGDDEEGDDEEGDDEEGDDDEGDDDDGDDEDENEVYGTVEGMPEDTLIGNWIIDGVTYVSTATTEIEEEHGPLAVGVSVEVEFEIVNDVNQLLEIESHPEAGEGPNDDEGMIESTDTEVSAASIRAAGRWQIGDVVYTVAPTTQLDEAAGALVVGATATVNSFTAVDGREIATQIRTLKKAPPAQNGSVMELYLPLFARF